jgi:hypothetical protein
MGKNSPSRIRNREKWANMPYSGFSCKGCGHPDYAHYMFAGHCIHEEMKPKDNTTCDCQGMDSIKGEK